MLRRLLAIAKLAHRHHGPAMTRFDDCAMGRQAGKLGMKESTMVLTRRSLLAASALAALPLRARAADPVLAGVSGP